MLEWHPRLIALDGTTALIAAGMSGAAQARGRHYGW